jgi:hypothetical protein
MRSNTSHITSIDISKLPQTARKELYDFYLFLLTKHSNKAVHNRKQLQTKERFATFLSSPVKTSDFVMLNRDERNSR